MDCAQVAEFAAGLPGVVLSKHNLYTCSEPGQELIKDDIREQRLNRVVVASCTPRLHEPTFRAACQDAGLNPYLFEMANIREHCSWVHLHEKEAATAKAQDLVKMAVARSRLLAPQEELEVPVHRKALVIDQMLNFNWKFLTPLALVLLIATAVVDKTFYTVIPGLNISASLLPWARAGVHLLTNVIIILVTIQILKSHHITSVKVVGKPRPVAVAPEPPASVIS